MKIKTVYQSSGEMSDTPAAIDRDNGILYLNPKMWFNLTPFQRKFIKWHEYGHLHLNTDSEIKADEYAFNKLAGTEFRSLKQCIECLEEILDEKILGHKVRIDHMYNLALEWDKKNKLNKASGSDDQATLDGATNLVIAANTANIKSTQTLFSGISNLLYTLTMIGAVIAVLIYYLKNAD